MPCEETRERLMELESSAFDQVEHLRTCAACRAFADQLRTTDGAMAAHVEAFAAAGDFDQDWARAKVTARRSRWVGFGSTAGLAIVALAALALLVVRPPEGAPAPTEAPVVPPPVVVEAPVIAAPPVAAAPPIAEPAPAPPTPRLPPAVSRPPRVTAMPAPEPPPPPSSPPPPSPSPSVAEPESPPTRSASPVAARPQAVQAVGAPVVIHIDPELSGIRSAELTCGSSHSRAARTGDTIRFDAVPDEACQLELRGQLGTRAVVSGGRSYRVRREGEATVLVPE